MANARRAAPLPSSPARSTSTGGPGRFPRTNQSRRQHRICLSSPSRPPTLITLSWCAGKNAQPLDLEGYFAVRAGPRCSRTTCAAERTNRILRTTMRLLNPRRKRLRRRSMKALRSRQRGQPRSRQGRRTCPRRSLLAVLSRHRTQTTSAAPPPRPMISLLILRHPPPTQPRSAHAYVEVPTSSSKRSA